VVERFYDAGLEAPDSKVSWWIGPKDLFDVFMMFYV
jgi:hypothetical protein